MPTFDPPPFDLGERYTLAEAGVVRGSDGMFIPEDGENRLWAQFLAWRAAGNAPAPAALAVVPVSGDAVLGAVPKADRTKLDPLDVARIAWRDDVPATNNKLKRIADKLDTTPDALLAAARAAS